VLLVGILAAKKFVIVGIVALTAGIKKLFGKLTGRGSSSQELR